MRSKNFICSLIVAAALTGCAAPLPSIHNVDVNHLTAEQAMLIVSTGADETCISFSSTLVVKEFSENATLLSSIGVMQLNNDFVASDFTKEYGKVYTLVLQPGKYDFWLNSQNPYMEIKDPVISEPITLLPKQIKYVGEVHSDGCGSLYITMNNKIERDIKFLQKIKPELNIGKVIIEPVKLKKQQ